MEAMLRTILILCASALAFGADDPWAKVKELKTGTELQVFKRGAAQPMTVKIAELTDDNLVVISKNEETAIPREEIERVDARSGGRTRNPTETKTTDHNAAADPRSTIPGPNSPPGAMTPPSTGVSSGVTWTKPGFETVYRRTASMPTKK
jgi:hypothetical protein